MSATVFTVGSTAKRIIRTDHPDPQALHDLRRARLWSCLRARRCVTTLGANGRHGAGATWIRRAPVDRTELLKPCCTNPGCANLELCLRNYTNGLASLDSIATILARPTRRTLCGELRRGIPRRPFTVWQIIRTAHTPRGDDRIDDVGATGFDSHRWARTAR